jgi:hypothetical protein
MSTPRQYFASNVLPSGKVFLVGGEDSDSNLDQNRTNTGEMYDPIANSWTPIATFPEPQFGDDPSMLLPNGKVLADYLAGPQTYIYDPGSNTWTFAANKLRGDPTGTAKLSAEEPDALMCARPGPWEPWRVTARATQPSADWQICVACCGGGDRSVQAHQVLPLLVKNRAAQHLN